MNRIRNRWVLVDEVLLKGYQPLIGQLPVSLWVNLAFALAEEPPNDLRAEICETMQISLAEFKGAMAKLEEVELVTRVDGEEGLEYQIQQPLSLEEFEERFGRGLDWQIQDTEAVISYYEKRIGMMNPDHLISLTRWVEKEGMAGEVVAQAIDLTARDANNPGVKYLEKILENWKKLGIRSFEDLQSHQQEKEAKRARPTLRPRREEPVYEGMPNAGAYQTVDPELVRRWKEMHKDEYDE